jgi:hypothetical protein
MKTVQVRFVVNAEVWVTVSPSEDFKSFHSNMQIPELEKIINSKNSDVTVYEIHEFDERMDVQKIGK